MAKIPFVDVTQDVLRTYKGNTTKVNSAVSTRVRSTLSPPTKRAKPSVLTRSMTPYEGSIENISASSASQTRLETIDKDGPQYSITRGPASYFMGVPYPVLPQLLTDRANNGKLRKRIKDQTVNLAQFCVEYRQAAITFEQAAKVALEVVRSAKRGFRFGNTIAAIQGLNKKKLANANLAVSYGIIPLLSDVHGAAEAVAKAGFDGKKFQKTVTARCGYEASRSVLREGFNGQPYSLKEELRQSLHSVVYYQIEVGALKPLAELGFTNPALLAWEILPYSFVIDYLINVGGYLGALDALQGTSDVRTCHTLRTVQSAVHSGMGKVTFEKTSFRRTVPGGLGMPRLIYEPSDSYWKIANCVSLLVQLKSRNP